MHCDCLLTFDSKNSATLNAVDVRDVVYRTSGCSSSVLSCVVSLNLSSVG